MFGSQTVPRLTAPMESRERDERCEFQSVQSRKTSQPFMQTLPYAPPEGYVDRYGSACEDTGVRPVPEVQRQLAGLRASQRMMLGGLFLKPEDIKPMAAVLVGSPFLCALVLSRNPLGDKGAVVVARLIASLPQLTKLELEVCGIGDKGANTIFRAAGSVEELSLAGNSLTVGCCDSLCELLGASTRLTTLNLANNNLRDNGVQKLCGTLLENHSLFNLSLVKNGIGFRSATALLSVIKAGATLSKLSLEYNSIGQKQMSEIAEAIGTNKGDGEDLTTGQGKVTKQTNETQGGDSTGGDTFVEPEEQKRPKSRGNTPPLHLAQNGSTGEGERNNSLPTPPLLPPQLPSSGNRSDDTNQYQGQTYGTSTQYTNLRRGNNTSELRQDRKGVTGQWQTGNDEMQDNREDVEQPADAPYRDTTGARAAVDVDETSNIFNKQMESRSTQNSISANMGMRRGSARTSPVEQDSFSYQATRGSISPVDIRKSPTLSPGSPMRMCLVPPIRTLAPLPFSVADLEVAAKQLMQKSGVTPNSLLGIVRELGGRVASLSARGLEERELLVAETKGALARVQRRILELNIVKQECREAAKALAAQRVEYERGKVDIMALQMDIETLRKSLVECECECDVLRADHETIERAINLIKQRRENGTFSQPSPTQKTSWRDKHVEMLKKQVENLLDAISRTDAQLADATR